MRSSEHSSPKIYTAEVKKALTGMTGSRAGGEDGLSIEQIKHAWDFLPNKLAHLWEQGETMPYCS